MSTNPNLVNTVKINVDKAYSVDDLHRGKVKIKVPVKYPHDKMKLTAVIIDKSFTTSNNTAYLVCTNVDKLNQRLITGLNKTAIPTDLFGEEKDKLDMKVFHLFNKRRIDPPIKYTMKNLKAVGSIKMPKMLEVARNKYLEYLKKGKVKKTHPQSIEKWDKYLTTMVNKLPSVEMMEEFRKSYNTTGSEILTISYPRLTNGKLVTQQGKNMANIFNAAGIIVKGDLFQTEEQYGNFSSINVNEEEYTEMVNTIEYMKDQSGDIKFLELTLFTNHKFGENEVGTMMEGDTGTFNADFTFMFEH